MSLTVPAYAKINLTLELAGRRKDGYHLLRMVMQSVSLCDKLTLSRAEGGLRIRCGRADVPCGRDNTVFRAAEAFFVRAGLAPGLTVKIEKKIPSQAGLGGGSADAACVLNTLNVMYRTRYSAETLREIGLLAGADVPFCVTGGTAFAEGIGEKLTPLPPLPPCHIVICKPEAGVDTKSAFACADSVKDLSSPDTDAMLAAVRSGNLRGVAEHLGNAFESVLGLPEVERIKRKMKEAGALGCCMTGSGSAVFGLFSDWAAATACKAALSWEYKECFLCRPVAESEILSQKLDENKFY